MNFFRLSKLFLYLIPFAVVIVATSVLFPFIVGKYAWFRIAIDLSFIFFLLGLLLDPAREEMFARVKKIVTSPLFLVLAVFTVVFLVAGFLGVDPSASFWSNFERGEGGLQILHLLVFYVLMSALLSERKDWKAFLWIVVIASILMIAYGVGAGLKYVDAEMVPRPEGGLQLSGRGGPLYQAFKGFVGPQFSEPGFRFHGSVGNPAYVAAYLLFAIFFALYILFTPLRANREQKKKRYGPINILLYIILALFVAFFFFAATRGAFIGLIAALAAYVIYLAYSHPVWRKWLVSALVIFLILVILLVAFKDVAFIAELPFARVFDISFLADSFQTRLIIWNVAFSAWKDFPILGVGPENFPYAFDRYFDTRYFNPAQGFGAWYDRAHSVIFDYLIETGILGLISYVAIFAMVAVGIFRRGWLGLRRQEEPEEGESRSRFATLSPWAQALFVAVPVAYLVQGLILFDVLVIYLPLFIYFALLSYELDPLESKESSENDYA